MPGPADSTNSSINIYMKINPVPPGGSQSNSRMGPGSEGRWEPWAAWGHTLERGSLVSGTEMDFQEILLTT